jgi:uridine kinase
MNLIDALYDLCKESQQPILAIDGPAGAGKTTLAENLQRGLARHFSSTIIHMDDLYEGWNHALSPSLSQKLIAITDSHKKSRSISLSRYDWASDNFAPPELIPVRPLLILEGVGCGQRSIRTLLSALIWIDVDEQIGLQRVLQRDGTAIEEEMLKWLTAQQQHFMEEDTKKAADFILTT